MDYYVEENLNDFSLVSQAMNDFTPLNSSTTEIRGLLTEGGDYSYALGGIVLESKVHEERIQTAKLMIPHSTAMVVHILNHAAEQF